MSVNKKKAAFSNLTHIETCKPYTQATHTRKLRPDENPIDIIKEFIKSGGGGTLSLTDSKTASVKSSTSSGSKTLEIKQKPKTSSAANGSNSVGRIRAEETLAAGVAPADLLSVGGQPLSSAYDILMSQGVL